MHRGRIPCEHESRDEGVASGNQGMPKIASKPPGARQEHGTDVLLQPQKEPTPSTQLRLGLVAARTVRKKFSDA